MSWYLANEKKIIDQFASGRGLSDLRREIEANRLPALQDFIDEGITTKILPCVDQLNQLAQKTRDESVKVTALGLAKLMRGQAVVMITDGVGYEGEDELEDESDDSLKHPKPAKATKPTVRTTKKKAAPKRKPIARKAAKKTVPKKDRARFERKVAKLKTELEKLPADRQEQLRRELEAEGDREE